MIISTLGKKYRNLQAIEQVLDVSKASGKASDMNSYYRKLSANIASWLAARDNNFR